MCPLGPTRPLAVKKRAEFLASLQNRSKGVTTPVKMGETRTTGPPHDPLVDAMGEFDDVTLPEECFLPDEAYIPQVDEWGM